MNQAITIIAKNFINLLYPLHCAICKKNLSPLDDFHVCEFCKSKIKQNPSPYYKSCGRSIAYSACLYEGALKELIHLFKYKGKISLSNILSKLMIDFIKEYEEILNDIDIITFVPIRISRLRERGFNQSKILAFNLSKEFDLPLSDALEKIRSTKPQNELKKQDRLINLKGAFRIRGDIKIKDCNILLVDDVITTGATLNECSKTLLDAGAKEVRCFTLARGV